jgi:hypothetical protein
LESWRLDVAVSISEGKGYALVMTDELSEQNGKAALVQS